MSLISQVPKLSAKTIFRIIWQSLKIAFFRNFSEESSLNIYVDRWTRKLLGIIRIFQGISWLPRVKLDTWRSLRALRFRFKTL